MSFTIPFYHGIPSLYQLFHYVKYAIANFNVFALRVSLDLIADNLVDNTLSPALYIFFIKHIFINIESLNKLFFIFIAFI